MGRPTDQGTRTSTVSQAGSLHPKNRLSRLFFRLIEPSKAIADAETRMRVKLLAAVSLVAMALVTIGGLVWYVRLNTIPFVHLASFGLAFSGYLLSRTSHYSVGAMLTVISYVVPTLLVSVNLLEHDPAKAMVSLYYLTPATMLGGLLLTFWYSLVVNTALIAMVAGLPLIFTHHPDFSVAPCLSLLVMLGLLTTVASWINRANRQALNRQIKRRAWAEESLQHANDMLEIRVSDRTTELHQANQTLEALVQSSPAAVVMLDTKGRVELWNPAAARMFQYTVDEVRKRPNPIVPKGQSVHPKRPFGILSGDETHVGLEFTVLAKNGDDVEINLSTAPLIDAAGKKIGFIGVMLDITQQRLLEAQYRQAQKMEAMGRLAGGIAHDFNNLLSVITCSSEMLKEEVSPSGTEAELVQDIAAAGTKAADLTRQLLTFSRKKEVKTELLDLNTVVSGIAKLVRRIVKPTVSVELTLGEKLSPLEADQGQIEQILMNFVVNANDAMPRGGTISIGTSEEPYVPSRGSHLVFKEIPRAVCLTVKDTGTGIREELIARIFDPFFTTKKEGEGTGQGLAMVYGIVTGLKGAIAVDSLPELGTAFRVYLPVAEEQLTLASDQTAAELPRGTETVLLVDDTGDVRAITARMLHRLGYETVEASSTAEALERFRRDPSAIDVVLSDVVMPGSSGIDCVRQIKALRVDIPVLLMSGDAESMDILLAGKPSTLPIIEKPFTHRQLAYELRRVLEQRCSLTPRAGWE